MYPENDEVINDAEDDEQVEKDEQKEQKGGKRKHPPVDFKDCKTPNCRNCVVINKTHNGGLAAFV